MFLLKTNNLLILPCLIHIRDLDREFNFKELLVHGFKTQKTPLRSKPFRNVPPLMKPLKQKKEMQQLLQHLGKKAFVVRSGGVRVLPV